MRSSILIFETEEEDEKNQKMEIEEDIEEFDSVTPSVSFKTPPSPAQEAAMAAVRAPGPSRAESLLINYAERNSIDANDLKNFVNQYVRAKFDNDG